MTRLVSLSNIADIAKGPIDPSRFESESFVLYSLPAYDSGEPELTFGREIKSSKTLVKAGDVLISKLNPRIPRVWHVREMNGGRQICSTEFIPYRLKDASAVDSEYLSLMALAPQFIRELGRLVRSSTKSHQRVRPDDIGSRKIPLPATIDEQRRIVARIKECMLRVEEIEGLAENLRQESRYLPQAFRFDLWRECSKSHALVELGSVVTSTKNGLYKPAGYHGSGALLMRMFNINGADFDASRLERLTVTKKEVEDYSILNGDILVSRVNSKVLVGKSTVVTGLLEPAVFEAMLIRLRVDESLVQRDVLTWLMNSPQFLHNLRMRAKHAIGQSSINQEDLLRSRLPLPPFVEQERIAEEFSGVAGVTVSLRDECYAQRLATDGLREAILRKAFAGDL